MGKRSLVQLQVQVSPDNLSIDKLRVRISKNICFIREIVPRGANGLVFEAKDIVLDRLVAVKIWIPQKEDQRDRRLQALNEAKKLAQLNHKNIVQIFDCGETENGLIYSVMEFLKGDNLDEYLRLNKPEFAERYRIWSRINEALSYAHQKGILHGDLHPGNVRVINGDIKLLDFGTSLFNGKQVERERESNSILKLARIIFPNDSPGLLEITDYKLLSLKPSLILAVISAWNSIVMLFGEIESVLLDQVNSLKIDDILRHRMQSLAFTISSAPVFSPNKLINCLKNIGVSSYSQDVFLGFCSIWAETRLSDSHDSYIPARSMLEVEKLIDIIWPKLLERFLERGPFAVSV